MSSSTESCGFRRGGSVTVAELEFDPYPVYARLRQDEPISWIDALGMWYVTSYDDVRAIAMDNERFTTAFDRSTVLDTFGRQMLSVEGAEHDRYRRAVQGGFSPTRVRQTYEAAVHSVARRLIASFVSAGEVDLRTSFAARLPILIMLEIFGMPADGEERLRRWYDAFEKAIANFSGDAEVRSTARVAVEQFHDFVDEALHTARRSGISSLLLDLVGTSDEVRLSDEEIRRNLTIIFFGGISTVEALILNSLWGLFQHPQTLERVRATPALLPRVVDETMRWLGPVQSATRHLQLDTNFGGVELKAGDVVNCMLGAANWDPRVFPDPERFDIDRPNLHRHLGFATGKHACLGLHLAKAEGRISLEHLLAQLPGLRLCDEVAARPVGYEFRQPRSMRVVWQAA